MLFFQISLIFNIMQIRSLSKKSVHELLSQEPKPLKRTKMINTLGPSSQNTEQIGLLIDSGMNVARLNFSHGNHEQHLQKLNNLKLALKQRTNANVGILLDTKGPQIRTGNNKGNEQVNLKKGQQLIITTNYQYEGTAQKIACSYKDLPKSTKVGKKILFADGGISSIVKRIEQNEVIVEILNNGKLGNKKNMCLPGTIISLPTITQKDKIDIIDFGLKYKVDFIAISFTRYKKDLDELRQFLIEKDPIHGQKIQLISKIENHQGIQNIDEIISGSDGIMIARGDLGMEVPIQKVNILQKYIMEKTVNAGKFVITATQMIQSMEKKPRPTRAEISDITNAVLDLTDVTMTSGQTANGQFPTQAALCMTKTLQQTQSINSYEQIFNARKILFSKFTEEMQAISIAFAMKCQFIFIQTDNLNLIKRLASFKPNAYICVFTDEQSTKTLTTLCFGVYCFSKKHLQSTETFIKQYEVFFNIKQKVDFLKLQINVVSQKIQNYIIGNYSSIKQ